MSIVQVDGMALGRDQKYQIASQEGVSFLVHLS
jgi:hypothetical protein